MKADNGTEGCPFDFTGAAERFKMQDWDLEDFCVNETVGYFLLNHEAVIDTPRNRNLYLTSLRSHILSLYGEGKK